MGVVTGVIIMGAWLFTHACDLNDSGFCSGELNKGSGMVGALLKVLGTLLVSAGYGWASDCNEMSPIVIGMHLHLID